MRAEFAKRWKQAAGTDFQPGFKDCLLVAKCSEQRELQLPELLQPDSPLFREALQVALQMYQEHYMRDPVALHLLAAPALIELEHTMASMLSQTRQSLAMWATHDTTILVLLAALGLWNGQWPPYTDTLVLEVYRNDATGESYFRLLHHGNPLLLPWCETSQNEQAHHSSLVPGLCNVKSFLPPWIAPFRDMKLLREACAKASPIELDQTKQDPLASQLDLKLLGSIRSFATYATSAAFCMFIGYFWRDRQLNRRSASQLEALLS
eukprot:Skav230107  [mRNA]  locus=scaffold283:180864:182225:- [translate_table: standard]